jgi:hypothetical protein
VLYAAFDSGAQALWAEQFGAHARGYLTGVQFNDDLVVTGGFDGASIWAQGTF